MVDIVDMVQDDSVSFQDDTVVQETDNQTLVILVQDHEQKNPTHDQHDNNGFFLFHFYNFLTVFNIKHL